MKDDTFLEIIDATPLVSIDLIIDGGMGKYLLGKRNNRPAQGFWFVPGGRIRKNETINEAFKRISLAELGLALDPSRASLLGAYDHIYDDNFQAKSGVNTHYVALGYKVMAMDTCIIKPDNQHSEMSWWSKNAIINSPKVHNNTKAYFITPDDSTVA